MAIVTWLATLSVSVKCYLVIFHVILTMLKIQSNRTEKSGCNNLAVIPALRMYSVVEDYLK